MRTHKILIEAFMESCVPGSTGPPGHLSLLETNAEHEGIMNPSIDGVFFVYFKTFSIYSFPFVCRTRSYLAVRLVVFLVVATAAAFSLRSSSDVTSSWETIGGGLKRKVFLQCVCFEEIAGLHEGGWWWHPGQLSFCGSLERSPPRWDLETRIFWLRNREKT